jgi:hypothetical protein
MGSRYLTEPHIGVRMWSVKGRNQPKELMKDVHVRIDPILHVRLMESARMDDRDLGSMIRILLQEALAARLEARTAK